MLLTIFLFPLGNVVVAKNISSQLQTPQFTCSELNNSIILMLCMYSMRLVKSETLRQSKRDILHECVSPSRLPRKSA